MAITISIVIIYLVYALLMLFVRKYWKKAVNSKLLDNKLYAGEIAVFIPFRNEEKNLLQLLNDLKSQDYQGEYSVYLIDDHSTDQSYSVVEAFIQNNSKLPFVLLKQTPDLQGKKAALTFAIQQSKASVCITLDADCSVQSNWLNIMVAYYLNTGCKLLAGPVVFFEEKSFFNILLLIEQASLLATTGAFIAAKSPLMCNGANLLFERSAFEEAGGYMPEQTISSGDDEFLMHRIYQKYPDKIAFAGNSDAIVSTSAPSSLQSLIHQRKRWSSKWKHYRLTYMKGIAFLVFLQNMIQLLLPLFVIMGFLHWNTAFFLLLIRMILEWRCIKSVYTFTKRNLDEWSFFITFMLYSFYVVFFGLISFKKGYQWKDRILVN